MASTATVFYLGVYGWYGSGKVPDADDHGGIAALWEWVKYARTCKWGLYGAKGGLQMPCGRLASSSAPGGMVQALTAKLESFMRRWQACEFFFFLYSLSALLLVPLKLFFALPKEESRGPAVSSVDSLT
jgi:hypothetical protein